MPKIIHNPEKTQKQKKTIGAIATVLLIIVMIISIMFKIRIIIWVPLALIIYGISTVIIRKIGKTPA